ncbi:MAG: hypothetical protein ABSH56_24505, partial [Bryobacteraceae bacterium]
MAALAIRTALIFDFDTWHISAESDHWSFGWETGRVARSVAIWDVTLSTLLVAALVYSEVPALDELEVADYLGNRADCDCGLLGTLCSAGDLQKVE